MLAQVLSALEVTVITLTFKNVLHNAANFVSAFLKLIWKTQTISVVCVMWGGGVACEGMHFLQSKNARLLN